MKNRKNINENNLNFKNKIINKYYYLRLYY